MKYLIIFFIFALSQSSFSRGYVELDLKEELFLDIQEHQLDLSYKQARHYLFNNIYLEKDAEGYYNRGVYCPDEVYYRGSDVPATLPDPRYMNTEHTWPQSKFSRDFSTNMQKTDLHHLYPSFSKINSQRGNLPFAEVNSRRDLYCQSSHSGSPREFKSGDYFEPADEHKGNVARSLFYFSVRYKMPIDEVQEYYLRQWHILDPVDEKEKGRHEMIAEIQKNRNPFIDRPELVERITDF